VGESILAYIFISNIYIPSLFNVFLFPEVLDVFYMTMLLPVFAMVSVGYFFIVLVWGYFKIQYQKKHNQSENKVQLIAKLTKKFKTNFSWRWFGNALVFFGYFFISLWFYLLNYLSINQGNIEEILNNWFMSKKNFTELNLFPDFFQSMYTDEFVSTINLLTQTTGIYLLITLTCSGLCFIFAWNNLVLKRLWQLFVILTVGLFFWWYLMFLRSRTLSG
jgi:hypothetical protein